MCYLNNPNSAFPTMFKSEKGLAMLLGLLLALLGMC
jgi:hypothetical protein